MLHPTGLRVAGSYRVGSIVGNVMLSVGWCVVVLGVVFVCTPMAGGSARDGWREATARLRFPSSCSLVPAYFLAATFGTSVNILFTGTAAAEVGVAMCGVVLSLFLVFLVYSNTRQWRFQSTLRYVEFRECRWTKLLWYIFGSEIWENAETRGVLFESYAIRDGSAVWGAGVTRRGRYALVEYGQVLVLVTISAVHVTTWQTCAVKTGLISVVFFVLAAATHHQQPFIATFLNHVVFVSHTACGAGMLILTALFVAEGANLQLLFLASNLIFAGLILNYTRGSYDAMMYFLHICKISPKRWLEYKDKDVLCEVSCEDNDITVRTEACDTTSNHSMQLLESGGIKRPQRDHSCTSSNGSSGVHVGGDTQHSLAELQRGGNQAVPTTLVNSPIEHPLVARSSSRRLSLSPLPLGGARASSTSSFSGLSGNRSVTPPSRRNSLPRVRRAQTGISLSGRGGVIGNAAEGLLTPREDAEEVLGAGGEGEVEEEQKAPQRASSARRSLASMARPRSATHDCGAPGARGRERASSLSPAGGGRSGGGGGGGGGGTVGERDRFSSVPRSSGMSSGLCALRPLVKSSSALNMTSEREGDKELGEESSAGMAGLSMEEIPLGALPLRKVQTGRSLVHL